MSSRSVIPLCVRYRFSPVALAIHQMSLEIVSSLSRYVRKHLRCKGEEVKVFLNANKAELLESAEAGNDIACDVMPPSSEGTRPEPSDFVFSRAPLGEQLATVHWT
jgi:hypothetical protein